MNETQVILNKREGEHLRSLDEHLKSRLPALRQAHGMWKNRDDSPTLRELRAEMDRAVAVEWIRK